MRLPEADARLVEVLRAHPGVPVRSGLDAGAVLARAELHGVAGVVHDALREAAISLPPALERELAWREAARHVDHAAHLDVLRRIDAELSRRGLVAVALKGPLFAERFYPRPSARATSDVDLLVDEAKLEAVSAAVAEVGYVAAHGADEERFRRDHHHVHFTHPNALPLEMHFHAYRGFGGVLPSEPLVERSRIYAAAGLSAIGVLAPEDELVYLAVHAAAHRFVRLGWLYDLRLLLRTLSSEQRAVAARRAREWGYARTLAYAVGLLVDLLGVRPSEVEPLARLAPLRSQLLDAITAEPTAPLRRSATRFLYTCSLCDSPSAALRYSKTAIHDYTKRIAGSAS